MFKGRMIPAVMILVAVSWVVFREALVYPFFQDDFFVLVQTRVSSFREVVGLFRLHEEVVYYRPIGIQGYFAVMQLAGWDRPHFFHLVSFLGHAVNVGLVYLVTKRLFDREEAAYLSAFFYAVSPIHYLALGWAVNFSFILLVTWVLASVWFWLVEKKIRAGAFLVLAVLTNEIGVILPGLWLLTGWRVGGWRWFRERTNRVLLAAGLAFAGGYLGWRFGLGFRTEGVYDWSISYWLQALRWYFWWIVGWTDAVKDQMVGPITFRWDFIDHFTSLWLVYLIEVGVLVNLLAIWLMRTVKQRPDWPRLIFVAGWSLISLLPVLFFRDHIYSHYTLVASLGFYWLVALILSDRVWRYPWVLGLAAAGGWLVVAVVTTRFNLLTSWLGDHARHSLEFQERLRNQHQQIPGDHRIYVVTTKQKVALVLAEGSAFKVIYGVDPGRVSYVANVDQIPEYESGQRKLSPEELAEEKITIFLL